MRCTIPRIVAVAEEYIKQLELAPEKLSAPIGLKIYHNYSPEE